MTDQDSSEWLTVQEAAAAYGVNARTIRRRIAGGQLAAQQVPGKFGDEWRVQPPPGYTYQRTVEPPGPAPPLDRGSQALIPLDNLERLLAPLAQERDELRADLERARAENTRLHEARLQDVRELEREVGRLHGLLEAAEAELAQRNEEDTRRSPSRWRWPWQR